MRRILLAIIAVSVLAGCEAKEQEPSVDIWTAAATGNNEVIEQQLALGTDIEAKDPFGGSSPLIVAALYGQTETAKLLVENGASLGAKNNDGATALHVASFFCHPEMVTFLLDQGADVAARNGFKQTALETISGEWNSDVEGLYSMVGDLWKLELDLDRIRELRPQVADLLRRHAENL